MEAFVGELDGEERGTGYGGRATLAKEARFDDAAVYYADRQMEHITANRIGHFDARGGVGQLTHIARSLEVIEDRLTEHELSIPSVNETSNALSLLAVKTR